MVFSLSTIELDLGPDFDILGHLPENPTSFIRGGQGIVGWGEALRLTATGPDRIGSLASQWRALVGNFEIKDELGLPGTGLVAFGSIAFADESSTESVLVVPKIILGTRDGRTWLTRVTSGSIDDAQAPDFWSTEATYDSNPSVEFRIGDHTPQEFKSAVGDAVENIRAGKLEKVVLARDLVAELAPYFDLRPVLARLAQKYPTCWVYSVDGMFGASPELLVRVSHGQVSARVLAGTAGRGTDPGVDAAIATALAASAKNTVEHAFAVDSLVNSLAPFCSQVDADPKPFSLALPNLWHLASDVHGVLLESASVLDLAEALHPTAAVAGTPRLAAQKLLAELEDFDRGRYAGPVGWIGADGDGEWAIALRGAQIEGRNVRAFAGCGIVEGSEPDAELAETELKFAPMRDALS
jgi:menaquinone-specific isochorismate synthase